VSCLPFNRSLDDVQSEVVINFLFFLVARKTVSCSGITMGTQEGILVYVRPQYRMPPSLTYVFLKRFLPTFIADYARRAICRS
jgi:hypothetical protein